MYSSKSWDLLVVIRNHVCVYSYQKKYTDKWIMLEALACDLTRVYASSKLGDDGDLTMQCLKNYFLFKNI